MHRSERLIPIAMLLLSFGFAGAAGLNVYRQRQAEHAALVKQILHVPAGEVVGRHPDYLGEASSPYTLVEFGDYQCPPCHAANQQLSVVLDEHHGQLRFAFRNLPLTTLHPYAEEAALVAESFKQQNCFWQVHDKLYLIEPKNFNSGTIKEVVVSERLDHHIFVPAMLRRARANVASDVREASNLNISSTPTFLLCRPDGVVFRLRNLDQVSEILRD